MKVFRSLKYAVDFIGASHLRLLPPVLWLLSMGGLEVQPLLLLCRYPTDFKITLIKSSPLL